MLLQWASGGVPINLNVTATRTSGVAPLQVFFDTSTTTSRLTPFPFSGIEYIWDFGDTASGNWGSKSTGAAGSGAYPSRNAMRGPIVCHIFETAVGSPFTVTCTATYNGLIVGIQTVSISVTAANTTFSGTNTIAINQAADSDFTFADANFPSCGHVQTDSLVTALASWGSGKRLLFKNGSTWTCNASSSSGIIPSGSIGLIGALGSAGAAPVWQQITADSSNGIVETHPSGITDLRIMDVRLDGGSFATSTGFVQLGNLTQVTFLNLSFINIQQGWSMSTTANASQQIAVHDCSVDGASVGTSGNGYVWIGATKFGSFQGNSLNGADRNHIWRNGTFVQSLISNNRLYGSSKANGNVLNDIKIHGNTSGPTASNFFLISGNKFDDSGWEIAPQNNGSNEPIGTFVVERNLCVQNGAFTGGAQFGKIGAGSGAVRNNARTNTNGSTGGRWFLDLEAANTAGVSPPSNLTVANNSDFTNDAVSSGSYYFLTIGTGGFITFGSGIVFENNLVWGPNSNSPAFKFEPGGAPSPAPTYITNSSDSQVKNNQPYTNATPSTVAQFAAANYAQGGGTAIPTVATDFNSAAATSPRDMGAVNH